VGAGGEPFTVQWTVRNIGQAATQQTQWSDRLWLSPDDDPAGPSLLLGSVTRSGELGVEETYTAQATFDLTPAAAGMFAFVETGQGVSEGPFDDNNLGIGQTPDAAAGRASAERTGRDHGFATAAKPQLACPAPVEAWLDEVVDEYQGQSLDLEGLCPGIEFDDRVEAAEIERPSR